MGDHKDNTGKTRVGKFLSTLGDKASPLAKIALDIAGDITGIKQLKNLSESIKTSTTISEDEKSFALDLLKQDTEELKEITNRWKSDMTSDSWLSKNVRPVVLMYLVLIMSVLVIMDSLEIKFQVKDIWITLIKDLLITVFLAYFGSRGLEKYRKISKK